MKNITLVIKSIALCTVIMLFFSCSTALDPTNPAGCNEDNINALSEVFVEKATAYVSDPTEENCKAYKEATLDFIEAVDDCDELYQTEFENAEQALEELEC